MRVAMRRHAAIAVMTALAVSVTACGSSGSDTSDASGDTYTIGFLNSMTGAVSAVGQQEQRGLQVAVDEINAAGGVKGRKIKVKTEDDQGSVNLTTAGFKKLATDEKVPVVIGPGITANAMASAPLAEQYGVTQVLLVAQPHIANGKKHVYGVPLPGKANSQAMVEYAKSQNAETAAIIWGNTPYGQEGNKDITAFAKDAGIEIVSSEGFDTGKFDFTSQASKSAAKKPDAVFLYGGGGSADSLLLKAMVDTGYDGKIIGDLAYSTPTVPDTAGAAADRVVSLTPVNYGEPDAETKKFLDAYKAKYNEGASVLSAYAYVAMKMVAAGIEKADAFEGKALAEAIQSLNFESIIGKLAYTDEYHGGPNADAFKPVTFKDGEFTVPDQG
ncbi:ABC transporter substrate-binding protein [Actinomadura sp. 7K534]|uniref:ABC transporter substrate-binding protein n=1 Tax=Actinomadura sp. 7K534 TaxID=2530366 RepID=UPI00104C644D|nr:ABC transporter substrate-binding protein [Actinomadura sp. 7K534]TDB98514.1 ABC transporter substrate-binding protein [Actinomadura sp. 7K534]